MAENERTSSRTEGYVLSGNSGPESYTLKASIYVLCHYINICQACARLSPGNTDPLQGWAWAAIGS